MLKSNDIMGFSPTVERVLLRNLHAAAEMAREPAAIVMLTRHSLLVAAGADGEPGRSQFREAAQALRAGPVRQAALKLAASLLQNREGDR